MDFLQKVERELSIRNYSKKTIKSYTISLVKYFDFLEGKKQEYKDDVENNIKDFLYELKNKNMSASSINTYLGAILFFYRDIMNKDLTNKFRFAKKPKRLPIILSREEIEKIVNNIENKKHRLMIMLTFGAGLRVSEITNLRVGDLDFENDFIHIKDAKGSKDRVTLLPERLIVDLKNIIAYKTYDDFVFDSQRGGKLSERTLQKVFENALKKSNITKRATFHSLRHSFATTLLENNVDIRYIQELMGHKNIRTTQIYTHVVKSSLSKIKSPL